MVFEGQPYTNGAFKLTGTVFLLNNAACVIADTITLMIFEGLAGSRVFLLFVERKLGDQDEAILTSFIPPIAFFIVILSVSTFV
jgi:hypothetical protein